MKGIILKDFEVRRLASAGSVLIWRRVKSQPPEGVGLIRCGVFTPARVGEDSFFEPAPDVFGAYDEDGEWGCKCPHGSTGETRFVKETWKENHHGVTSLNGHGQPLYKAAWGNHPEHIRWRSPVHMPEALSRFRVTLSVSCRQMQSVTEEEAVSSGAEFGFWHEDQGVFATPVDEDDESNSCFRDGFGFVIESRHTGSWKRNEWQWAINLEVKK